MSNRSDRPTPNTPLSSSRREFLGRLAAIGAAGLGGSTLLAACGGDGADTAAGGEYPVVDASTCQGYDALDQQALAARQALNYQDSTPEAGQYCGNCRFKQDYDQDASCIGCQLFAGPVSPGGWCQSWAALPA
jgi:hypothetical protein